MNVEAYLASLTSKHTQLKRDIEQLEQRPLPDDVIIHDLKKKKLWLKDEMERVRHL